MLLYMLFPQPAMSQVLWSVSWPTLVTSNYAAEIYWLLLCSISLTISYSYHTGFMQTTFRFLTGPSPTCNQQ